MEVASSIVGLLAAAAQLSSLVKQFIEGSINAPDLALLVHYEIHDFSFVLSKLHPTITGEQSLDLSRTSLIDADHLSITLAGCVWTFSKLEVEVNRLTASGKMDILDRMKWSWMEKSLAQLIQQLQSHKLSLNLILTILTSQSSYTVASSHKRLSQQLEAQMSTDISPAATLVHCESLAINSEVDAITRTTTNNATLKPYRLGVESVLFRSRPYRSVSTHSGVSVATSQRPNPKWSIFTRHSHDSVYSLPLSIHSASGITLAEAEDIPSLPLPIGADSLCNLHWYNPDQLSTGPPALVLSPQSIIPHTPVLGMSSYDYDNALTSAASQGRIQDVLRLLGEGLTMGMRSHPTNNALIQAIISGHQEIVKVLLENSVTSNTAIDDDLSTPLHVAAQAGNEIIVEMLLDSGTTVDCQKRTQQTPLHLAGAGGHFQVVQLLLDRGANMKARTDTEYTVLHLTAEGGHTSIVEHLLDAGAEINPKTTFDQTPLHLAAARGRYGTVQLLLERGAEIEARTWSGQTALHLSAEGGYTIVVQHLLSHGAEIDALTRIARSALHLAAGEGHSNTVQLLLDRGLEPDLQTYLGETALHIAAIHNRSKSVKLLLKHGANKDAVTASGETPLSLAGKHGCSEVYQLLRSESAGNGSLQQAVST